LGKIEGRSMKLDKNLEPFRAAIEALQRLLIKQNDRGVIIGGIAVSLLGKPRFTADVDAVFLLSTDELPQFLELARAENIVPRIQDAEEFAQKSRVLLLRHEPTETDIDISLGILPFEEEMVDRSSVKSFANLSVRLPTPEDLIIMKAIAHRPKDLEDIRILADNFPNLDKKRIEQWVKAFGDALETPLWDTIKSIIMK
jgi:predicted nucleotidyltransferase